MARFYGPLQTPEDPTKCVGTVYSGRYPRQCKKNRGLGPGGKYCKDHIPEEEPKSPRR